MSAHAPAACRALLTPHLSLVIGCLLLCAACAAIEDDDIPDAPPPRHSAATAPQPEHQSSAEPTAALPRAAGPRTLQDNVLEDAPRAATPEVLAAVPSPPIAAPDSHLAPTVGESVLPLIVRGTPPNVAAALRLIEQGRVLAEGGQLDQALDRYERALAVDPSNVYGYYFLAQLHYLNKHYDQALAFASRAAGLSTHTDRNWLARINSLQGQVLEAVGRYPDARHAYQKAAQTDPENSTARDGMARLSPR